MIEQQWHETKYEDKFRTIEPYRSLQELYLNQKITQGKNVLETSLEALESFTNVENQWLAAFNWLNTFR